MSNPLPQQKDPPFSPAPMAGSNQWINNLSADNRSQLFAGQARDVYFDRRENVDDVLDSLPTAADAPFNAYQRQHDPTCLTNTRVDLLEDIYNWANGRDERRIFWLNGLAGTGKSTIARTVARRCFEQKRLGASFFFSRGGGDVGHAAKFVTSIAWQLANYIPSLRQHICDAMKERRDIISQSLRDQWHQLVLDPILKLGEETEEGYESWHIIVVDALDECDNDDNIRIIIHLLAEVRSLKTVRIRVFMTSRPEVPIRNGFIQMPDAEHQDFILHNISQLIVNHDIRIFLEHNFKLIAKEGYLAASWPGTEIIERLVQNASGLFIWAATACHFIRQGKRFAAKRLDEISAHSSTAINAPEKHLNKIYITVLRHCISPDYTDEEAEELVSMLKSVLGSIATLLSPLSTRSLSKLLDKLQDDLFQTLDDLHAILDIPEISSHPLRLHHPSFRDFLFEQTRCEEFWVDQKQAHQVLADCCIRLMSATLRQDILGVNHPGTLVSEVKTSQIEQNLPPEVQYACLYWIEHVLRSEAQLHDRDKEDTFLKKHLLHWLEALGWMGKVSEGVHAIASLGSFTSLNDCPQLSSFLYDAKRFVLYNRPAVEQAPLQTYSSALMFAPKRSIVRRQFEKCIPGWIRKVPTVQEEWNTVLQTLEGHTKSVNAIAFSTDGKSLASASDDRTVKVWDAGSGAVLQTLEGHSASVHACTFLSNSKSLISMSMDGEASVWDSGTGELLFKFDDSTATSLTYSCDNEGMPLQQNALQNLIMGQHVNNFYKAKDDEISPDGMLSIGRADSTTTLYNYRSKGDRNWHQWSGFGSVKVVVFSPDSKMLAAVSDESVTVWNTASRTQLFELSSGLESINTVVFSPNSRMLASVLENSVRVWDTSLRSQLYEMTDRQRLVKAVVFSPDSKILASVSDDSVKMWNIGSGELLCRLSGDRDWVQAVFFSPDSVVFALVSNDSVTLWRTTSGAQIFRLSGQDSVQAVVFSPNSKMLASVSDKSVIVLNTSSGAQVCKLSSSQDSFQAVVFSPDSRMLASVSEDSVTVWNTASKARLFELSAGLDSFKALVFSRNSNTLALVSDGRVKVWNTNLGVQFCNFSHDRDWLQALVFSPDGKMLASVSDVWVRVWNARSGAQLCELLGGPESFKVLVFSPDNNMLASMSDESIIVWNTSSGAKFCEFPSGQSFVKTGLFSPDSKMLVLVLENSVRVCNVSFGFILFELPGGQHSVTSVVFSPDSRMLASVSDESIRVWKISSGIHVCELSCSLKMAKVVAFSPQGQMLASVSDDSVSVWNTSSGEQLCDLSDDQDSATDVVFSPNSKMLALLSDDSVTVWNTGSGAQVCRLSGGQNLVKSVVFSPDSNMLASNSNGSVIVWNPSSGTQLCEVSSRRDLDKVVAATSDGKLRAEVLGSNLVKLYNIITGEASRTLEGHSNRVTAVGFSPDAKLLVSASEDTTVRLWDTSIRPALPSVDAHWDFVTVLAFSPNGKLLASASNDRRLKLWDTDNGALLKTFIGHSGHVSVLVFSPDSKLLASASTDATICLRNTATETVVKTLKGHLASVFAVAFSPSGKLLASASDDGAVKLWDTTMGWELKTLKGHSGRVSAVAFSPDGRMLVSASNDGIIKVWDAGSGTVLQTLKEYSVVTNVSFSLDSTTLYTNLGSLPIWTSRSPTTAITQTQPTHPIFIEDHWVYLHTRRALWLPPDHRPCVTAVHSGIIALGHASGEVMVIELAP